MSRAVIVIHMYSACIHHVVDIGGGGGGHSLNPNISWRLAAPP